MFVAGKRHLVRLAAVSVRYQPSRLTVFGPALLISIQSDFSPSSSNSGPSIDGREFTNPQQVLGVEG